MHHPISVLFLCRHNSARSQIAEALLRHIGGDDFTVSSAGADSPGVDPLAQTVLAGIGIDTSGQTSKPEPRFYGQPFDYIITLCARSREHMPDFPGDHRHIHWDFPDPLQTNLDEPQKRAAMRHLAVELAERIRVWVEMERQQLVHSGVVNAAKYRFAC